MQSTIKSLKSQVFAIFSAEGLTNEDVVKGIIKSDYQQCTGKRMDLRKIDAWKWAFATYSASNATEAVERDFTLTVIRGSATKVVIVRNLRTVLEAPRSAYSEMPIRDLFNTFLEDEAVVSGEAVSMEDLEADLMAEVELDQIITRDQFDAVADRLDQMGRFTKKQLANHDKLAARLAATRNSDENVAMSQAPKSAAKSMNQPTAKIELRKISEKDGVTTWMPL